MLQSSYSYKHTHATCRETIINTMTHVSYLLAQATRTRPISWFHSRLRGYVISLAGRWQFAPALHFRGHDDGRLHVVIAIIRGRVIAIFVSIDCRDKGRVEILCIYIEATLELVVLVELHLSPRTRNDVRHLSRNSDHLEFGIIDPELGAAMAQPNMASAV